MRCELPNPDGPAEARDVRDGHARHRRAAARGRRAGLRGAGDERHAPWCSSRKRRAGSGRERSRPGANRRASSRSVSGLRGRRARRHRGRVPAEVGAAQPNALRGRLTWARSSASSRRPCGSALFVLLCLAALVVTGIAAWRDLPVEAFPDLTNNQVVVVTTCRGLAAPEVEQRITFPIETALMGTPGAEQVRSISKFGLSIVTIVFDDNVPIYFARQLVSERLADVAGRLPQGAEPTLGPVATAFGEIYQYLVEGDTADAMAKKTLHDWDVRNRLRSVPGVSEVNSWGGITQQFHVVVDPRRLEKYALSLREVAGRSARNNASFSGGFVEHRAERVTVRGVGLATGRRRPRADRADLGGGRADPRLRRGAGPRRAHAAPGRRHARRPGREHRRHGHHAEGRERPRGRGPGEGPRRGDPEVASSRPELEPVLRPVGGDRPHVAHGDTQPDRGLAAGGRRAARLPARHPRRADRRRPSSPCRCSSGSSACGCSACRPT